MFKVPGGARQAGLGGIPIIQVETVWIHKSPGEALGWRGWLLGRAKLLVPPLHFCFSYSIKKTNHLLGG